MQRLGKAEMAIANPLIIAIGRQKYKTIATIAILRSITDLIFPKKIEHLEIAVSFKVQQIVKESVVALSDGEDREITNLVLKLQKIGSWNYFSIRTILLCLN